MNVLDAAIVARLQTNGSVMALLAGSTSAYPLPIYKQQALEGAPLPYIVFSMPSETDPNETPRRRKDDILFIRAYATGSNGAAVAGSIDDRIDSAVHLIPLTVSGWANIWLAREQGLETVETTPTGALIFMRGANYRAILNNS